MEDRVSNSKALAYGMGSLGNNIIYAFIVTYLMYFYTDVFGIAAGAIAIMFLVARIWDALNDPIMGIIVDNTNSRWGRFRPYLLYVPFVMGIFTVLCFYNPDLTDRGKLIYAYITYIAWGMSFTAMDIPYWSMSAAITQNPIERNKVVMVPRTLAMVGFLIVNLLTLPLVSIIGSWTYVAAIYAFFAIVFTLITFFFVEEKVTVKREKKQTFSDVVKLFLANKPLRMLIYSMIIIEGLNAVRLALAIYYLTYNLNAEAIIPIFLGLYLLMNILGAVISPILAKRLGKKRVSLYSVVLISLTSIGMYFTGYSSLTFIFLWNAVGAIAIGASNIAMTSMLADCVEYGQYKTGNRAEGMVFSTNIFKTKLASAIGGAFGAASLSFAGYVPNVQQSVSTLDGIHLAFSLIPGLICLIALIPLFNYDLTEEQYNEILVKLKG
ncbi:glycoside/pentoside/hexuronide:cation symporter, GPH family [Anaerobranca californiensis DSM 14826]|jgi:GPH family glycoside/pentoside/hexuronide:cation symporter/probable glucitol transport protein GutA|uniref:Glycoside/pentoside/hexuronide:cation symporter, GPH family n=1 Tax=Anaerobranca californiensis DSM 14826 TaxID=1120989 RepID=A0A1M6K6R5_9FIRM|nr:glycoside-pentoside-hexuronide (GPH):cation symporter [Anaerobranca californiensis]SHJ54533.1 glycoside/pentoside/hexuronide:cation symporter, GPH family [Anaerobranca californiensis DSM 14826]